MSYYINILLAIHPLPYGRGLLAEYVKAKLPIVEAQSNPLLILSFQLVLGFSFGSFPFSLIDVFAFGVSLDGMFLLEMLLCGIFECEALLLMELFP